MTSHDNLVAMTQAAQRDRAVGTLVGLAVGDAVGTTLEFKAPGSFTPINDMVGGGPFGLAAGEWTDDTSMAMCLAESILDTGTDDPADQLRRYVAWRRDGYWSSTGRCFDIGGTTARALSRFEREGSVTEAVIDPESAANGSLMRLAAVPIRWHRDVAEAAERSGASSRTTHPADRPVDACRVYGAMIAALIQGMGIDEVLSPGFWTFGPLDARVEAVARGSWRNLEPPEIRGTGYVVDALQAAIWAVAGANDFRDAILRAANLGDDADTTAAIAGQLAGARWGAAAIPASWSNTIIQSERIATIARRLYDVATDEPPPDVWPHDEFVHAYWVEPGRILAGEYPGDLDAATARTMINLLVDHGIRTFVDLTDDPHLEPYSTIIDEVAAARGLALNRLACPIPDMGVIDASGYDAIAAEIRDRAQHGGVYVHCWGGIGRTGTVIGCLLANAGLSGEAALARITVLRSHSRKAHIPAPQTSEQVQVIRSAADRKGA